MDWIACGPRAALFRLEPEAEATGRAKLRAAEAWLEAAAWPEVVDFSSAFDRLLVEFSPGVNRDATAEKLAGEMRRLSPAAASEAPVTRIPVSYDGPDLAELAARRGLSVAEVIELHVRPVYEVAFIGFSPGFPYLSGLDPALHAPRRAMPRPRVPAGSVAIGGSHTGIYSVASPGGWHILGITRLRIFDPNRTKDRMFLLRPGDRVRFEAVG